MVCTGPTSPNHRQLGEKEVEQLYNLCMEAVKTPARIEELKAICEKFEVEDQVSALKMVTDDYKALQHVMKMNHILDNLLGNALGGCKSQIEAVILCLVPSRGSL